ncbi:MarR family transcriptional regulator [Caldibacillus lycopersici]|uniref:MarR family transcriptional regulator n=1 Tax=Perspicuibacillus lycopersici TaxID=1325689 RepID=A0AAE3LMK8_9BACI|nr:MarR family transcriptional regulator [Perspicuibacillus lycopersici]MCU9613031.1 MarR family transcriptional regulator [Perspicuibacillus lycopersici]
MDRNTLSSLIWLRMARFVQRSNHLSNEFLEQYGLTAAQFDVLAQIQHNQPITQTELADKLTLTCGGISRMLTRLEKENLIIRKQQWKIKYISLTDKGSTILNEAIPAQVAFQASMFDEVLDEAEKKQLYALVKKLHKASLEKTVSPK